MFNFQQSQINQQEFDQIAKQLLNYPRVYATSKFDVGKKPSPLHLPLKFDEIFKTRASKVHIHYKIK